MDLQFVKVKNEHYVTTIELDHAPANTLSSSCINELRALFAVLADDDDTRAIIVTGAGRFFVAGADIKEFVSALGDEEKALAMAEAGQALCNEIEAMTKPVIAAINGPALGGGLELAMGCHFRIASETAILGLPELKLGLIPSFGGTQRLSKLTNKATALRLILTSKQLHASEAAEIGLVQMVVTSEELIQTAVTIAQSLIDGKSMTSISRAVECIMHGYDEPLNASLDRERKRFAELFLTADAKEGIQAFVEKRSPQFTHS
ncbi:enoyl-CoA hydratase-related protein [Brevibacillus porteri]|uniref:Enoyl-CoA hydratase n=1 Tax=Brevibacillus porteri TaxID=2126350 RepID=A0ABX5FW48_9BACL|nr:enoyl-CoA hydratase-related protein [Brevibacillus porteri]MED1798856.1 enoyl-CoA hydratase-related protein [Brevibacillus porteri]MED2131539.1 enoyl-CoA hydratase-related protein [Brevibacillus porteri]MED2744092.1 enoyl-CoA hydratase-related protein [Brevibacillus porteri]MED2813306.1 enoyl-CoA hydratase-related protein [Brevibacillus porteri]MED2896624.1 enoyl-CoA hydratase-related protein [Brevibacillus porteri]